MLLEMLADTDKKKRKTLICTTHLIHFLVICFVTFLFSLLFRSYQGHVEEKENVCFTFSCSCNPCGRSVMIFTH